MPPSPQPATLSGAKPRRQLLGPKDRLPPPALASRLSFALLPVAGWGFGSIPFNLPPSTDSQRRGQGALQLARVGISQRLGDACPYQLQCAFTSPPGAEPRERPGQMEGGGLWVLGPASLHLPWLFSSALLRSRQLAGASVASFLTSLPQSTLAARLHS